MSLNLCTETSEARQTIVSETHMLVFNSAFSAISGGMLKCIFTLEVSVNLKLSACLFKSLKFTLSTNTVDGKGVPGYNLPVKIDCLFIPNTHVFYCCMEPRSPVEPWG